MGRLDEKISAEFAAWEVRGRGWQVWPNPVRPEPAFREFTGYLQGAVEPLPDDGRRQSFLASFFDSLHSQIAPRPPVTIEEVEEPEPLPSGQPLTTEFVASLPAKLDVRDEALRAFLDSLNGCSGPAAFELFGNEERVAIQFASSDRDAPVLHRQLTAFLPTLPFTRSQGMVAEMWSGLDGVGFVVEFGLAHEFMLPLQTAQGIDPFVGLVAVLSELRPEEAALFQVMFEPVKHPWAGSVWRSVTDTNGKMLFVNQPPLIPGTKMKLEAPLFGVVVRAAAKAPDFERAADIVREMARALHTFARADGNELIPLTNDEYPFELHEEDVLLRQSRRSGMLLNREELIGFVHLPSNEVQSPRLRRESTHTKSAPKLALAPQGLLIGENNHAGKVADVRLTAEQRVRHMHVIGASGTGKSTLLFNLILQDIQNGAGVAVLDPHGDLIERILGVIPPERIEDVVLLDPTDEAYSIGFNILSAHSDFEKNLLASDLVSVFKRLSTSWGDQMGSVLNNAILAFLESSRGGTLSDLRRFLLDAEFCSEFLATVNDPDIVYYWRKGFPQLGANKSIGPILTRLDTFLSPKPIRYMVSQKENRLDFADILDSGKIFLAKLPQGQMGKENSFLLGSLLVSKFQQLAMSRQRLSQAERRDYWLYIDEFHSFITPSMAEILSGARKYRLGLVLAHHELHQLQRDSEVASAVLSHPYTRLVFRVGDSDAHALEKGFASFEERDLQNLAIGEAIGRIERSDWDFNLKIPLSEEADPEEAKDTREKVVTASREKYARARSEIEAALWRTTEKETTAPPRPARPKEEAKQPEPTKPTQTESSPTPVAVVLPSVAVTEPAPAPVAAPVAQAPQPEPAIPPDMGIGGAQHKTIQKRLKTEAEALGFQATIEKQVPQGKVDLALERAGQSIACEISATTTIDHEFQNVTKCLAAGFSHVAVVSKPERLRQIGEAVRTALAPEAVARVGFYSADELIAFLRNLPVATPAPNTPTETIRRGRKVKVKAAELTAKERQERESAYLKLISETMRRKP